MSEYTAQVIWERLNQNFLDNQYSRKHLLRFDGGLEIPASSSPHVVPPPFSDITAVDPEEMLVAALSNCHMLFFLAFAAKRRFLVDSYTDNAVGTMAPNTQGKLYLSQVTLNPKVIFSGDNKPSQTDIESLHHRSHAECYIANSVLTVITINPIYPENE